MKKSLTLVLLAALATILVAGVAGNFAWPPLAPAPSLPSPNHYNINPWGARSVSCISSVGGMSSCQRTWYISQGFPNPIYNRWATGYQNFHGVGKYKVHSQGLTWNQALNVCASEGSILTVIDNDEEAAVIKNLITAAYSNEHVATGTGMYYYWIGAKEMGTNMKFFTILGEPLGSPGYLKWSPWNNQPDNYGNNDCVCIMYDGTNFDAVCSERMGFVCEKVT